ncbi:MAG TPA: ATP-binding protein [Dongiaceae bacterium]|nr:ATP-binding protein [Dongiaceae bacterium]
MADLNDPQPEQRDEPSPRESTDTAELLPVGATILPPRRWRSANGNDTAAYRYRRAAVLILGVAISLALALVTHNMMQRKHMAQEATTRQSVTAGLQTYLDREIDTLQSLRALFESSEFVTADEFQRFAVRDEHIQHRDWWMRMAWAPRVQAPPRAVGDIPQDAIALMMSGRFPMAYIEPDETNAELLAFDIAGNPAALAAMRRATATRSAALSTPIHSALLGQDAAVTLAFVPVFPSQSGLNQGTLAGFVVGFFAYEGLIDEFLDLSAPGGGLAMRVRDGTTTIFSHGSIAAGTEALPLKVGDRTWRIEVASIDASLQTGIWIPALVMLFGLALTTMLYLHLVRIDGEYGRISAEVRAATEELAFANRELGERSLALQSLADDLRRTSNEAQIANAAKTMFLANMSHELRTPLNAMIGFSEIISQQMFGSDVTRYTDYARDINSSGKHLLGIIEDLLDMSRIELGKLQLHETRTALAGIVEDTVRLLQFRASEHAIRIVTKDLETLPDMLLDSRAMRQAFINLITNSVKFSGSGTVVTVAGGRGANGDVTIAVIDQGRGIDEAQMPHIFDSFWQGDAHRRRAKEGIGLGLAITRRLIEAHGGSITAQSRKHVGTTMTIRLPASRVMSDQDDAARAAS